MTVFVFINNRPTFIRGSPNSGWSAADPSEAGAKSLSFNFKITDDGSGNFILVYSSTDGVYAADTWHRTIEEADAVATEQFGIRRSEWTHLRAG